MPILREPTRTDDNWLRITLDEVYNGWIIKVSTVSQGSERITNKFVCTSAEDLLTLLKDKLTNA